MHTSLFSFHLPPDLIAQFPAEPRDHAKLLCIDRKTGIKHHNFFYDIVNMLGDHDVLVMNNSRVIPARLFAKKEGIVEDIELFLVTAESEFVWECLAKPARKLKIGDTVEIQRLKNKDEKEGLKTWEASVISKTEEGHVVVAFKNMGESFWETLKHYGRTPLPPYIDPKKSKEEDYQTVFADKAGSIAAPTAGLHFTTELLEKIKNKGVQIEYVDLHVGLGTFLPVKVEDIKDHQMHSEYFELKPDVAERLNEAKKAGKRIIAVGTTSVRVLESSAAEVCGLSSRSKPVGTSSVDCGQEKHEIHHLRNNHQLQTTNDKRQTSIFISPGYQFKFVDALITNFHLPQSTLIMLVSAFYDREKVLEAYEEAIEMKYRFYSFGDAMFIY